MYMNARIAIGIISEQADTWRDGLKDEMRSNDARRVAEFIAAQQQEIERLQGEGESLKFRLHRMRDCRNCKSLGQCDNCDTGTLSGWEDGTRESENANGG